MFLKYSIDDCYLLKIPTFIDKRGVISVLDKELPFMVKRIFWLHHIQSGECRGGHSLVEGTELLCAIHGSFVVDIFDGINNRNVKLDNPEVGLIIQPGIWFLIRDFRADGVALVLASEEYNRDMYINDFSEFLRIKGQ